MLQDYTQEFLKAQSNYRTSREGENSPPLSMKILSEIKLGFVTIFSTFFMLSMHSHLISRGIVDLNIKHRSLSCGENLTPRCRITKIKNYINETLNQVIK
jgi:hypothetical protein